MKISKGLGSRAFCGYIGYSRAPSLKIKGLGFRILRFKVWGLGLGLLKAQGLGLTL